ncbi:MAG TPA: hypothetical protein ENJ93_01550 [Chloroflexi bacterium]|nr:hypothetical protein [Chloroflexota bacterium]
MTNPPKFVFDEADQLVEVILSVDDYLFFLRVLADKMDWESLPSHLQDAVDLMLIDEVRHEKEMAQEIGSICQIEPIFDC